MAIRNTGKDASGKLTGEGDIAPNSLVNDHLNRYGPTQTYVFEYNFAVQAGAAGVVTLYDADPGNAGAALKLPYGFIVLRAYCETITAAAGATSTMKLGITGNDDLFVAATAFDNALFAGSNVVTALTKEIPATVTTAGGVSVIGTIATADWTAGKFRVHVEGREGSLSL